MNSTSEGFILLVAELLAGKVVSVAGFLLRLRAEDVAPPEFELIGNV